jgi:uncharacterized protein
MSDPVPGQQPTAQPAASPGPRWRVRPAPIAIACAVLLGAAALSIALTRQAASATPTQGCGGSTPRLTVQGVGQASGSPNSLDVDAQVSINADTAAQALALDDTTTNSVVQAIEATGVKSTDIQTTDLTINPNYSYPNANPVITGYDVSNSIAITITKLADAGTAIDAATTAGGDALSIGSLDFTQVDSRKLQDRARQDAVRQAVTHAGAMARAAGQRLGVVCSINDQSSLYQGVQVPVAAGPLGNSAARVPLEGGTEQASAQVTVVYELEPRAS